MKKLVAACLLPAVLSGCPGFQLAGQLGQQVPGIVGQVDSSINAIILQKAVDLHNLQVGLAQIQATPGMVVQVTPPTTIGTPMNPGAPVTVQPAPPPAPLPGPSPGPPVVVGQPLPPRPPGSPPPVVGNPG